MPAISISFNRFLLLFLLQIAVIPLALGELPNLDRQQMQWLGDRVFANECNRDFDCLTSWNSGEDFPSLGIGHFIWYRAEQNERFEETFPDLLQYYKLQGIALPTWLAAQENLDSPWLSREQFLGEQDSSRMQELRQFLADTTDVQVMFIVNRLHESTSELFRNQDDSQRRALQARFDAIANADTPLGMYALIDYVHFKGTGLSESERYRGQGWGLLQVLIAMDGINGMHRASGTLDNFVAAAARVLERRVANAPSERNEQRWLAGWKNRLQTYLPNR